MFLIFRFCWKQFLMFWFLIFVKISTKLFKKHQTICSKNVNNFEFLGILLPYLRLQISSEMCWRSPKAVSTGQDTKSPRSGVSGISNIVLMFCVCLFFKGWSSAMKHRDYQDPSFFALFRYFLRKEGAGVNQLSLLILVSWW